jgi:hypothetical protein
VTMNELTDFYHGAGLVDTYRATSLPETPALDSHSQSRYETPRRTAARGRTTHVGVAIPQ